VTAGHLQYLPLLVMLIIAAVIDVRARRIPNWLTLSLALSGLAMSLAQLGALSEGQSALGLLAGLGIGLVMFILGAWGAGDAKLVAGIGAWLGATAVVWVTAGAAVIAMVAALVAGVLQGRFGDLLRGGALLGLELMSGSHPSAALAPVEPLSKVKARTLPLAVPLVIATAAVLAVKVLRELSV
jgi:prepilin peptidase CpaA